MLESYDYVKYRGRVKWTCGKCKTSKIVDCTAEGFTCKCNCGRVMVVHKGQLVEKKAFHKDMLGNPSILEKLNGID